MARQPLMGQGPSLSGSTITHRHTDSVRLLWISDQPVAETFTWQHTTLTRDIHPPTPLPPAVFEPAISAGERRQTHALDSAATGIGKIKIYVIIILLL